MVNGMLSIKEYAEARNKSTQAVYQQVDRKSNKEALKGHIFTLKVNNKNTRYLDEEAVRILDEASSQTPSIVIQNDKDDRIADLEKKNEILLEKVAMQADKLAAQTEELRQFDKLMLESGGKLELAESRADEAERKAEESQSEIEQLRKELSEAREQLEEEKNRKLTFKEWRQRRKGKTANV